MACARLEAATWFWLWWGSGIARPRWPAAPCVCVVWRRSNGDAVPASMLAACACRPADCRRGLPVRTIHETLPVRGAGGAGGSGWWLVAGSVSRYAGAVVAITMRDGIRSEGRRVRRSCALQSYATASAFTERSWRYNSTIDFSFDFSRLNPLLCIMNVYYRR